MTTLARCQVRDLFALTSRTITDEGFLVARAHLARGGNVQEYRARELGLDVSHGMAPDKIVKIYRPADQVFDPKSMATFDRKPMTLTHPPGPVTADTWSSTAVGDVHGIIRNGDYMDADVIVRDKKAVKAVVVDGVEQLSNGYSFDLNMTAGVAPDGTPYDGIQENIVGNHTAIVDKGRAGPNCRIGDEDTSQENTMSIRMVDGITLTFADATQESVIMKAVTDAKDAAKKATDELSVATTRATDAEGKLKLAEEANKKLIADHKIAIDELTKKVLTEDQIQALAAERSKVVADAKRLMPEFDDAKKSVPAIRTAVLGHVLAGDTALKGIATAALGGVALDKADEGAMKTAFSVVIAAAGNDSQNAEDAMIAARDAETGRAMAGDGRSYGKGEPMTGVDIIKYRETHGGKNPPARA